ncbi:MAG: hypothetical protein ACOYW3_02720 [Bacteroidota bacterium]
MTLDVTPSLIRERFLIQIQTLRDVQRQMKEKSESYHTIERECDELKSQFGWREHFVGGHLGGNVNAAERVKLLEVRKHRLGRELHELEARMKSTTYSLSRDIAPVLAVNSKTFQRLVSEAMLHSDLKAASEEFGQFLQQAKRAVETALMMMSWQDLLQHPRASEGLNQFKEKAQVFGTVIKNYEANARVNFTHGQTIEGVVNLQSKDTGIQSFRRLASFSESVTAYAEKQLHANAEKKQALVDHTIQLLLADQ